MVQFKCPVCAATLKVEDELAGKRVTCSKCGEGMIAPASPVGHDKGEADGDPTEDVSDDELAALREMTELGTQLMERSAEILSESAELHGLCADWMGLRSRLTGYPAVMAGMYEEKYGPLKGPFGYKGKRWREALELYWRMHGQMVQRIPLLETAAAQLLSGIDAYLEPWDELPQLAQNSDPATGREEREDSTDSPLDDICRELQDVQATVKDCLIACRKMYAEDLASPQSIE